MVVLSRADTSLLGRWWWTVDRWTIAAVGALVGLGMLMTLAASPAVAERIGLDPYSFVRKQLVYLPLSLAIVLIVSMLPVRQVRRLALLGFLVAVGFTALTLVAGIEIKGARRWIALPGMSLQPSEFVKPCFAVLTGWLLAEARRSPGFPGRLIAVACLLLVLLLLKMQPDIGMALVVLLVFFAQAFVAGLPIALVGLGIGGIAASAVSAYLLFPHVQSRVHRFLDPEAGDNYQIARAMEAFGQGGLFGRGPGEGRVKASLPDAHADFVFAVAGEEFGLFLCLIILGLFGFIVLRGFLRAIEDSDGFAMLAAAGLVTQFGIQAFVNMASSVHLVPTKGMTLPFLSYGGSSVFAVALGIGMLLALTRRRNHGDAP